MAHFSGKRSCGDIDDLKFFIEFFENLQKKFGSKRVNFAVKKYRIFDQIFLICRSNFCIFQILFSYKQMVFPAIKAPLFCPFLMRIFAVLLGFFKFCCENYRIFDRIFVF